MWYHGTNVARCKGIEKEHSVPDKKCHCGFNAWHDLDKALSSYKKAEIIGAIAGAGETRIHLKGFRCSQAQILALYSEEKTKAVETVAKFYQIPVFYSKKDFLEFLESLDLRTKDDFENSNFYKRLKVESFLKFISETLFAVLLGFGVVFGPFFLIGLIFPGIWVEASLIPALLFVALVIFSGFLMFVIVTTLDDWRVIYFEYIVSVFYVAITGFVVACFLAALVFFEEKNTAIGEAVFQSQKQALEKIAVEQENAIRLEGYYWPTVNNSLNDSFKLSKEQKGLGWTLPESKASLYKLDIPKGQQTYKLSIPIPSSADDKELKGKLVLYGGTNATEGYRFKCLSSDFCETEDSR